MLNEDTARDHEGEAPSPDHAPASGAGEPPVDESIIEEIGAVIDDAKIYATAELAFQKTRAKLLGKNAAIAAGAVVLAIILLHISLIALAVGLVLALEPHVTIWGAIAIVVGVMLLGVGLLGYAAVSRGRFIAAMFAKEERAPPSEPESDA